MGTVVLVTGCGTSTPPAGSPVQRHEDLQLRIACSDETAARIAERHGRTWTTRTGATIETIRFDPMKTSLPDIGADVWIIRPAELPRWASREAIRPVPSPYQVEGSPYAWENLFSVYRFKLLIWDGRAYALPLLGDAPLCYYRADWLNERPMQDQIRKKYGTRWSPGDSFTWEELAEIAEFASKHAESGTTPRYALPPLPASADGLDREFYPIAAPLARRGLTDDRQLAPDDSDFAFHFDARTGEPKIDSAAFVQALGILQRLQRVRMPGSAAEPAEAFRKGETFFCLAGPEWIARFQNASSKVRNKFGICRVPGSRQVCNPRTGLLEPIPEGSSPNFVPYLGADGWLAVVSASSRYPDQAFELIAAFSDPATSSEIVLEPEWGGAAFRRIHMDKREGWYGFGLDRGTTAQLMDTIHQTANPPIINPVLRLRIPDERDYQEVLVDEVRKALAQGTEPKQAMTAVAQRWRVLGSRKDPKQRLAEYRRSLTLQP